jgi:2'-5' RNA ligase
MSYTIGIGALLDTKTFNLVRSLELTSASATQNYAGLGQPPHITIKRPFQVATMEDVEKLRKLLSNVTQQTAAFDVQYLGLGNFGDTTLFLAVQPSAELQELHEKLLSTLQATFGSVESPHEGKEMVFHTSIAVSLQKDQLQLAKGKLTEDTATSCHIGKLGLFLGLHDNTHWSIISETELA